MKISCKHPLFFLLFCFSQLSIAQPVKVIVNEKNPMTTISVKLLQDLYFKRANQWPDGQALRFFDRSEGSTERSSFLNEYLKKSPRQIDQYWIGQKLYSGYSAPSKVSSDRMVTSLVARFPGGISYVSETFIPSKGVKILGIVGD